MSSPEELSLLEDEELFEFLLKEGFFMPDISVGDNILMEDWGLPEPEPLDKDMDDLITSILNPFQNGAGTQQDDPPAGEGSSMPEDQLQLLGFINEFGFSDFSFSDFAGSEIAGSEITGSEIAGSEITGSELAGSELAASELAGSELAGSELAASELAGSELAASEAAATDPAINTQNSEVVQVDHNYSQHWDWSLLQSIASELADMGEENMSTDADKWQRVEGTSTALVPTSGFPVPAPVDAVPQAEAAIAMQASFPELVLTEEQKQLLMAEDFTCMPLTQAKDQLTKKIRRKVRRRRSTQSIYGRKKRNMNNSENNVAACMTLNQTLGNVWVLQKQNGSLFGQFRQLQAFVNQPSKRTAVAKTYTMAILFFDVFFSPSPCTIENIKAKLDFEEIQYLMLWKGLVSSWFPLSGTPRAAHHRQKRLCSGKERGKCDLIMLPQMGNPAAPCACDLCRFLLLLGVTLGILPGRGE